MEEKLIIFIIKDPEEHINYFEQIAAYDYTTHLRIVRKSGLKDLIPGT